MFRLCIKGVADTDAMMAENLQQDLPFLIHFPIPELYFIDGPGTISTPTQALNHQG